MNGAAYEWIPSPERLAYWYFRLNGFLTTENFLIHGEGTPEPRTEIDLLAVRFGYRRELLRNPMIDDDRVATCPTSVNAVIAEVKTGRCRLNGPWRDREAENVKRMLLAFGCVPDDALDDACNDLYGGAVWSGANVTVRLFAIGDRRNDQLHVPERQQLLWSELIHFFVQRFAAYDIEKTDVNQWAQDGQVLKGLALNPDAEANIRVAFGLHAARPSADYGATR